MGLYKKGILGYFRGKVGTVVGAIWNGIHYMRSLPDITADNPTEAQVNVRAKLALVSSWLKFFKAQIHIGFQAFTKGTSPFSAAVSYHVKNAVTGVAPMYTLDYPKVLISVGDLDGIQSPEVELSSDAQLDISWSANSSLFYGKPDDLVTFMTYNPAKKEFVYNRGVAARSALAYALILPASFSGDSVVVWMSVVSADGKLVSNSQYLGEWLVL